MTDFFLQNKSKLHFSFILLKKEYIDSKLEPNFEVTIN